MRVLHVIARMNAGGTSQYLKVLSQGLTRHGIENPIATGYVQAGEHEDECVKQIPIIRVEHLGRSISPLNDFRAWRELRTIISNYQPDIVHSHTFKAGLISRLIKNPAKRVHTFHGHLLNDGSLSKLQIRVLIMFEKYLARKTNVLISVGQVVSEELKIIGIGTENRWVSIPPGIEPLKMPTRESAAINLGIDAGIITVAWLGRMVDVKNPLLALEIAALLPEYQFILAGDGELLEACRSRAPHNAHILGWASREQVLAASDLLLMTSRSEGMPLAAIEAQMAGKPVVGPRVGSLPEIIPNSQLGIITENNANHLAAAIRDVITDQAKVTGMMVEGAREATRMFHTDRMINAHVEVYLSIMDR